MLRSLLASSLVTAHHARKNTRWVLFLSLAVLMSARPAHAQSTAEVEPNDSKAQAQLVAISGTTWFVTGVTTGSGSGGGTDSADYYRIRTPSASAVLRRHRLTIISSTPGHTLTIRGLDQASGVIGTTDVAVQTAIGTTTVANTIQWYGFGKQEEVIVRVTGNASTTDDYLLSYATSTIGVAIMNDLIYAGTIEASTTGAVDTDMWLYDSNFNAIVGAGNDQDPANPAGPARLLRTLAPGTYNMVIGRTNLANNLPSPADDAHRNGNVLDFPNAVAGSSVGSGTANFQLRINDNTNPLRTSPALGLTGNSMGETAVVRFTLTASPAGSCCAPGDACTTVSRHECAEGSTWTLGGSCTPNLCCTPPIITVAPAHQVSCNDSPVTFSVTAAGTPPLTYQWRRNGVAVPGATASELTINNPDSGGEAEYSVLVSNVCGSAASQSAYLYIGIAPEIITQPQSITPCLGGAATFTVTAGGYPAAGQTYQWRKNSQPIAGATGSTYTIPSVSAADAGTYTCRVEHPCGLVLSDPATLVVAEAPTIGVHPEPRSPCSGSTTSLSVLAGGSGVLVYQWRKNGQSLGPSGTGSTLTLSNVTAADSGTYDCVISNTCGTVTSNAAAVNVLEPIVITSQPANAFPCNGAAHLIVVVASSLPPPSYQWRFNGTDIPGASDPTYLITSMSPASAGTYSCRLQHPCGTIDSAIASIQVGAAPQISSQPTSTNACVGVPTSLSIGSGSIPQPSAQWRKGGVPITGATSPTFDLPSPTIEDTGSYDCILTSPCGTVSSVAVTLTVHPQVEITAHPSSSDVCPGGVVTFTVVATTAPGVSYHWKRNGSFIPGATSPSYTISAAAPADVGAYRCVVTGFCGSVESDPATLTLRAAPTVLLQPQTTSACEGSPAVFSVTASGSEPLTYQWRKDGVPIPGADSPTLHTTGAPADEPSLYDCVVSNSCGSDTSDPAVLVVHAPPTVLFHPIPVVRCAGDPSWGFAVEAGGTPTPTYQWRFNGHPLPGQIQPILSLDRPITTADAGTYDCIIANVCGSVTSLPAEATVSTPPLIDAQPVSQTTCLGSPAQFSVSATATPPPEFQWRRNGSPIPGATAPTYAIPSTQPVHEASFDCVVTNSCGSTTSLAATLTIEHSPSIEQQPQPQTSCPGRQVNFSVAAVGTEPLVYQWRRNGGNLPGATSPSLVIPSFSTEHLGVYDCTVSNSCGQTVSTPASLTLAPPPAILSQPADTTVCAGSSVAISFAAHASGASTFQWHKDGQPIPGQTSIALFIGSASASDTGSYTCLIADECGSVVTEPALLSVVGTPTFTVHPSSVASCLGSSVTLAAAAQGDVTLHYQWDKDNLPIPGATSPLLMITSLAAADAGEYRCRVSNSCDAEVESEAATVTVLTPPAVISHPTAASVCQEDSIALSITASGGNLHHQWRKNGVPVPGATLDSLTITAATASDAGLYDCLVSNPCGSATSQAAQVSIDSPPEITSHPTAQSVCVGEPASFSVAVTGTPPFLYQWFRNSIPILDATESSYTTGGVDAGDFGWYSCEIRNHCGFVHSQPALLSLVANCPQPGACCDAGGLCFMASQTDPGNCAPGSTYQGDDTTCTPTLCALSGSCCITFSCSITDAASCNGVFTPAASCEPNPCLTEVEPNDNKVQADLVVFSADSGAIYGLSTGSAGGGGTNSTDYYLVRTAPAPLGVIYRHRLSAVSTPSGHTLAIRGLNQASGVINPASDASVQTSAGNSVPPRTLQWYGFGREEQLYVRVSGTASTTSPYALNYSRTPVSPVEVAAPLYSGPITITTSGTTDTDLWLYDHDLFPIPLAGNDQDPANPTGPARLTRSLAPGTYTLAVTRANLANNLSSPTDDANRNGNVLDFPNALAGSVVGGTGVSFNVLFSDGLNPDRTAPASIANNSIGETVFVRFTVIDPPLGACCSGSTCLLRESDSCTGPNSRFVGAGSACNAPGNNISPCCKADFNQSGATTVQDIFDFLAAYFASSPSADVNNSGTTTVQDIFDFLAAYFAGCN